MLKLSMRHIKVWFTAGMGFFTDAYDLFIIGAIISTIVNAYNYAGIRHKGVHGVLSVHTGSEH